MAHPLIGVTGTIFLLLTFFSLSFIQKAAFLYHPGEQCTAWKTDSMETDWLLTCMSQGTCRLLSDFHICFQWPQRGSCIRFRLQPRLTHARRHTMRNTHNIVWEVVIGVWWQRVTLTDWIYVCSSYMQRGSGYCVAAECLTREDVSLVWEAGVTAMRFRGKWNLSRKDYVHSSSQKLWVCPAVSLHLHVTCSLKQSHMKGEKSKTIYWILGLTNNKLCEENHMYIFFI